MWDLSVSLKLACQGGGWASLERGMVGVESSRQCSPGRERIWHAWGSVSGTTGFKNPGIGEDHDGP